MNKTIIKIVIAAIVAGGVGFYGGMLYVWKQAQGARQQRFQGMNAPTNRGGGFVSGEIITKDDKSVTVKLQNGGSKIIFFSSSADITKSINGIVTDLEIGRNIMVNGTINQDGSVSAQTIQVR